LTARRLDLEYCDALVNRVSAGNRQARQELVTYLWPFWLEYVKTSHHMGSLARSDDHVRNVAMGLMEKAGDPASDHFDKYTSWRVREPDKTFDDWTRIVVVNQVRSYVRKILGVRTNENDEPSPKRLLNEYIVAGPPKELGIRPPFTAAETARELMEFARSRLSADQLTALGIWLQDGGYGDIEQRLSLAAGDGKRLVRAAMAVLRRHFGTEDLEDEPLA
jgi:hypothetical protein